MDQSSAKTDAPDRMTAGRSPALRPLALAATGALSLVVFAAAGWLLRAFHEARPTRLMPDTSAPVAGAWAEPKSRPQPQARGRLVFQVFCARCHGP
jgi:hypothetical protein